MKDVYNNTNHLDFIDIYAVLHSTTTEHIIFSNVHSTLIKIDNMLRHK